MRQICTELLEHIYPREENNSFISNSLTELRQVKGNKLPLFFTFEKWLWLAGNAKDIHDE